MWQDFHHVQPRLDGRRTVWVVDDSPTDAERVRRLLAHDHDVEVLHDGAAALERLASGEIPDLLVLDWVMPSISGIDVCRYVRSAQGKLPQVPILLLTARHGTQEILQAFNSGANDYVSKPFVDEELEARVGSLLQAKQLLERAEEAEADARALLVNAPDPILAVNAQGLLVFANDEAVRVLRRPRADLIGQRVETLVPALNLRNIALGAGEPLLPLPDVEVGGRIFSPSVRLLPSDNAATTTVALRDVTDRRRAEALRLDYYSIIAHDLRSPITSVLLRLERIMRGRYGIMPAELIADLRKIEASLRAQVAMINDFLELARLEGVGYKIDRKPVDAAELVRRTMEDFRPLLEGRRLVWKAIGLSTSARVVGDRQRLMQVVSNLVSNAVKFTDPPGVITTALSATRDHVELSVEDTGRGIAKEELENIFKRYTRARDAGSGTAAGTGLGLMIVRELVEAHGGVVGVESKPGRGSRFWLRLPRYAD